MKKLFTESTRAGEYILYSSNSYAVQISSHGYLNKARYLRNVSLSDIRTEQYLFRNSVHIK
jgi:hypothetical protein